MMHERVNDYRKILDRIQSARTPEIQVTLLGSIPAPHSEYPLCAVSLARGGSHRVLISAGIHGDEPAGVEALCHFLERREYRSFLRHWEIVLIPCINPYGYEHGTRKNGQKLDLNRLFKYDPEPEELSLVKQVFVDPFHLTLELHEDGDSPGYYLYQSGDLAEKTALGRKITRAVEPWVPVNQNSEIEGMPAESGVIERLKDPDKMKWWPMALFSLSRGARACLTMETPTHLPMKRRVEAHLQAIRAALANYPWDVAE